MNDIEKLKTLKEEFKKLFKNYNFSIGIGLADCSTDPKKIGLRVYTDEKFFGLFPDEFKGVPVFKLNKVPIFAATLNYNETEEDNDSQYKDGNLLDDWFDRRC